jgi:hypothetical protein
MEMPKDQVERYALPKEEIIYLCEKNNPINTHQ